MTCPICDQVQHCPCNACASRNLEQPKWKWATEEDISCGKCGHTMNANAWESRAYDEYAKQQKVGELNGIN